MRPRNVTLPNSLPEEVKALGNPIAAFETGIALYLYVAGVLFLLSAAFIAGAFIHIAPPVKAVVAGVVCAVIGVSTLRKCWQKPKLRVFLFPQGLACLAMSTMEIVYWTDINRIIRVDEADGGSSNLLAEGQYQVILVGRDGRQFLFNESLSGLRDFYKLVKEHTLQYMVPPAIEAYETGATIGFGDVSISREGIHIGLDILAWDRFESAKTTKGRLIVRATDRRKPFCRVPFSRVPNVHVLLARWWSTFAPATPK